MESGKPVLIENLNENIVPVLWPLIRRATKKHQDELFIQLGDAEVKYHPDFQLYLHTKLSNPHYPPEVHAECTMVNFTVTPDGLEDQLLALVVRKERPDLATQKTELVHQQHHFRIKLAGLEDEILKKLANAKGDITQDRDLIESLEKTKTISGDITQDRDLIESLEKTKT